MRKQERETTEHNEYSGAQLYMGGRRYGDDLFSYKKMTFCFNRPCDPNVDLRSRKVQKILKCGVLEKEPRSNGPTSYQADRYGYLPEVKIEILE
jgi:hypothetical protein